MREFDFLKKIGIIDMLSKLRFKKIERLRTEPNSQRRRTGYLMMRPVKVNYPQRAGIALKFSSTDLELFGGYQGAVKYSLKKGIYENDLIILGKCPLIQTITRNR